MRLIKLDTTSSTNDFLKDLANSQAVENFTVVSAESQTNGRGQMGSQWHSEKGKNLTMSILITDVLSDINQIYSLNVAVALGVVSALKSHQVPDLSIKWPNDIMSGNKKIGGILIENTIRSSGKIVSIAGIGLNVNQTDFGELPKASSVAVVMGRNFDKQALLISIRSAIIANLSLLQNGKKQELWDAYLTQLFKVGVPMPFQDQAGRQFMGIIKNVNENGKLELLLENEVIAFFEIKQIQMLY